MYLLPFFISTEFYSTMNFFSFLPDIPVSLPSVIIPETTSMSHAELLPFILARRQGWDPKILRHMLRYSHINLRQIRISWNHRTIEWFGLEETFRLCCFFSSQRNGHLPLDQVAQNCTQTDLEHFQGGEIYNFSVDTCVSISPLSQ